MQHAEPQPPCRDVRPRAHPFPSITKEKKISPQARSASTLVGLGGGLGGGLLEADGDVGEAADRTTRGLTLVEALVGVGLSGGGGAGGDDGHTSRESDTRGKSDAGRQGDGDLGRGRGQKGGESNSEELHFASCWIEKPGDA